jgi:hypothetical protein
MPEEKPAVTPVKEPMTSGEKRKRSAFFNTAIWVAIFIIAVVLILYKQGVLG